MRERYPHCRQTMDVSLTERSDTMFLSALDWLRDNYDSFTFFTERDIVWTLQLKCRELVQRGALPVRIFNDYGVLPGTRRSRSVDLAFTDTRNSVLVAVEFKYEPAHSRSDIPRSKFPVVFWGNDGVGKDVARIREIVSEGAAAIAHSIFIDEGGAFRHRDAHAGSAWLSWNNDRWILRSDARYSPNEVGG